MKETRLERWIIIFLLTFGSHAGLPHTSFAADKLRFGAGFAWAPGYVLVEAAAQEQGLWRKQGLEVEWIGFRGGADMMRGLAGDALDMGVGDVVGFILAASQGAPVLLVAKWPTYADYHIWVLNNSPLREAKDLKGTKIGVFRIPSTTSAFAILAVKAAGLSERDIKLVGVGGQPERVAALKRGIIDGFIQTTQSNADLIAKGEIRSLINIKNSLPKDWIETGLFARKRFLEQNPQLVKRALVAIFQAIDFVRNNRIPWAAEKVRSKLHS